MFIRSTGGKSQLLARAWRGVGIKLIALAVLLMPQSVALATSWAAPANQPASTAAPTLTVNSVSDLVAAPPLDNGICETVSGNKVCTLRAAIMKANHFPGGGATIAFASHAAGTTYLLTRPQSGPDDGATGDLNITATVTIVGNGAGITIIDGNGGVTNDGVFLINPGILVTMTGVTIQRGRLTGLSGGAGLLNDGRLTLDHSAVLSSTSISIMPVTGGGILSYGQLTVTDSLIAGNGIGSTNLSGGGIDHEAGTLTVYSSTVSSNTALNGGGVYNTAPNASFVNSTIISNTASFDGGGLINSGSVTLVNSTISGNNANVNGGGILNSFGCGHGGVSLFNVTIADNQADADFNGSGTGGGIYNLDKVQLQNSLVADNSSASFFSHGPDDCHGTPTSGDYNLISVMTYDCTLTGGTHDQTNVSAHIGLPNNNGGPTLTNALLPGSPAIDAGNPGGCDDPFGAMLASDQRGSPRPANGAGATRCDIGEYELQRLLDLPLVTR